MYSCVYCFGIFWEGFRLFYVSDIYSFVIVMIDFSLLNWLIFWEGEVVNFFIIYDFVCRGERFIVILEDLSGLEFENVIKWMLFF